MNSRIGSGSINHPVCTDLIFLYISGTNTAIINGAIIAKCNSDKKLPPFEEKICELQDNAEKYAIHTKVQQLR